ncbi:MAG: bifunctional hydroxymethylpyrimidine kinase/phosphomethylpyrimidine kinase [Elusimicrobiaceae bacterium]|uniref:Sugar kinase n=1 Tax=Candidatus Avelusimicrobium gallicola TaxID=2562704 RepID=A0A928HI47_9BACT|nr:sugar kinase [Elusimicrobium sp.]MBQ9971277.1 bifunctional hydroxymethylpyrimidine kinase/phosphomethylpyrimidine kinase [Elusimicrobiaceae bacterium]
MANEILVVGSVAFDTIENANGHVKRVLGGAASYSSICASYYAQPSIVAVVGTDFTEADRAPFVKRGVDLTGLEIKKGKTFHWGGSYDKDFNTAVTKFTDLNVFQDFNPVLTAEQKNAKAVFLANIDPELQLSVLKQVKKPRLVACDTMNYWISSKKETLMKVIKKIDILFLNETEARQLTGEYNLVKAGRLLLKQGVKYAIIKLGSNGSMLVSKKGIAQLPPYILEHVHDTTGAGDTFGGGFTGYLASQKNWNTLQAIKRAMMIGNVMASFTIESFSVDRLANLTRRDINKRLKEYTSMLKF